MKNQIISPNRGTIYDSNGEVLAQSISVDTISLNPGKVVYANGKEVKDEVIAEGISNIFDITYEEMIEKLESGKSVIIIQKKVETDKVEELKSWLAEEGITAGFNIDEDSKRYYPNEKLASNLIGFCGTTKGKRGGCPPLGKGVSESERSGFSHQIAAQWRQIEDIAFYASLTFDIYYITKIFLWQVSRFL